MSEDTARNAEEVRGFVLSALETEVEASHDQCADTGEEPFAEYVEIQRDRSLLLALADGQRFRVTVERSSES